MSDFRKNNKHTGKSKSLNNTSTVNANRQKAINMLYVGFVLNEYKVCMDEEGYFKHIINGKMDFIGLLMGKELAEKINKLEPGYINEWFNLDSPLDEYPEIKQLAKDFISRYGKSKMGEEFLTDLEMLQENLPYNNQSFEAYSLIEGLNKICNKYGLIRPDKKVTNRS